MADDIKIKVGVQSSVKADMDRLVADMNKGVSNLPKNTMAELLQRGKVVDTERRKDKALAENEAILDSVKQSASSQAAEYKKMAEQISSEFGAAGTKSGEAYKRSLTGSGIKTAFTQLMRGDISGAIESLSDGLNLGMKSMAAKAVVWGGGILTAFTAGWKAGKAIDEMLGISQKIADAWAGPMNNKIDSTTKAMREARLEAMREAEAAKRESDFQKERGGIIAERGAIGGTAQDRLNVENEKMVQLFNEAHESGLSIEEQRKRLLEYEKQINAVKSASIAADKESADAAQKEAEKKRKLADDEQQWNAEIAAADVEAGQNAFRRDIERAAEKEQAAKDDLQAQLAAIQKESDARLKADADRKERLQAVMAANKFGVDLTNRALDPKAWRDGQKQDRMEIRAWDRDVMEAEKARAAVEAGRATERQKALVIGMEANANAKQAREALNQLEVNALEAQVKTARLTKTLNDKMDALIKKNGIM